MGMYDLDFKLGNSYVKTRFLAFDLDLWPTTLTYDPNLAKVKVNLHTDYQGRRSNGLAGRGVIDGRTDGLTDRQTDATKYIISLASQSIIT